MKNFLIFTIYIFDIRDDPSPASLAPPPRCLMAYFSNIWKDMSLKFLQDTGTAYKVVSVFEQLILKIFKIKVSRNYGFLLNCAFSRTTLQPFNTLNLFEIFYIFCDVHLLETSKGICLTRTSNYSWVISVFFHIIQRLLLLHTSCLAVPSIELWRRTIFMHCVNVILAAPVLEYVGRRWGVKVGN